jgi:hypothetical protein
MNQKKCKPEEKKRGNQTEGLSLRARNKNESACISLARTRQSKASKKTSVEVI